MPRRGEGVIRRGISFGRWIGVAGALGFLGVSAVVRPSPVVASPAPAPQAQKLDEEFSKKIFPMLDEFCLPCHSGEEPSAGLSLEKFKSSKDVAADQKLWDKVVMNIRSQVMPPPGMPAPSMAQRGEIVGWIQRTLSVNCSLDGPGKVTIRRLNRSEYDNTIRDLLYVSLPLSADFPSDDVGYGFDNIGDVLTLTPLHMEKYLAAAKQATDAAIRNPKPKSLVMPLEKVGDGEGRRLGNDGESVMYTNSQIVWEINLTEAGDYTLTVEAAASKAGPDEAKMLISVGNVGLQTVEVKARPGSPTAYKFPLTLQKGTHRIGIAFINDYYNANHPVVAERDRNMAIYGAELAGPAGGSTVTEAQRKLLFAMPSQTKTHLAAAREVLTRFMTRAYRRPATDDEMNRLMEIYLKFRQLGDSYEDSVKVCMQAVLVNPNFLFRVELDSATTTAKARDLGGYELASRLSYFLWNTMPDDRLFQLAASGELLKEPILRTEVLRMIGDPKAETFFQNFSTQWLQTGRLEEFSPDPAMFPGFDSPLRHDLEQEVTWFFADMIRENRPAMEFFTSDYTFLNRRLASHYRIPGAFDDSFRRVDVSAQNRGGVLGMGAILSVTSNPTRTSPVKRGKFVMEQVLGTPPPPPPPNVGVLEEDKAAITAKTVRERLEQHRADPSCASCHKPLDAYGFSLENYDAVGRWRTQDGPFPVDTKGDLPDGRVIASPRDLKSYIVTRQDDVLRSLTEKILTYAVGRGLTATDYCEITDLIARVKKRGGRMQPLIEEIVVSNAFRRRTVVTPTSTSHFRNFDAHSRTFRAVNPFELIK